jgi:hypothetical protein
MSAADWLPKWWVPLMYKYEFLDPGMSFDEEVIAAVKRSQAKKAQEAEPQKNLELKEAYNVLDRINVKLGTPQKRKKIRIRLKKRR